MFLLQECSARDKASQSLSVSLWVNPLVLPPADSCLCSQGGMSLSSPPIVPLPKHVHFSPHGVVKRRLTSDIMDAAPGSYTM